MPLFNRNKSKRKKGASNGKRGWLKAKPAKRSAPADRAAMWQKLRIVAVAGAVAGLGVGTYFALGYIEQQVGQSAAATPAVVLHGVPGWMGAARTESLRRAVAGELSDNPLDYRSLEEAYAALGRHPWVESVDRIARPDAGRVEVYLSIRTPVAVVGASDGFHLVDSGAHRLPGVYRFEELAGLKLPAITGVAEAPPAEGQRWPGDDLAAGIALALRVAGKPWAGQVEQVNVANHAGRLDRRMPQLVLITHRNGKINWGRPIGDEGGLEPGASQKLANLDNIAFRYGGRVDAGAAEVDLFTVTPFIHPEPTVRYTSHGE